MLDPACDVIAFTGSFGSGCTTAAKALEGRLNATYVGLSSRIKAEWAKDHEGDAPRQELQRIGDELRKEHGISYLAENAILSLSDDKDELYSRLIIDGVRNRGEIEYLRREFGFRFTLIGILADPKTRWDRIGQGYVDAGLSEADFLDDDQRDQNEESETGQEVELCIDQSDVAIVNDGATNIADFRDKVERFALLAMGLQPGDASEDEVYMHQAYSARYSSRCIKRNVGAIIVTDRKWVVATGYNENPTGTLPCRFEPAYTADEHGPCFRDIVRNSHFRNLADAGASCPVCGEKFPFIKGPPWRCPTCEQNGVRTNLERFFVPDRAMNLCTAVHAEVSALLAAGSQALGATLYTTTFPCMQCAEKIIHCGVKRVVYTEAYPDTMGRARFTLAGVELKQFEGVRSSVFDRIYGRLVPEP